jgi:xanthine dehydrogenase accessory factor
MLIAKDGRIFGTIGGGLLEARALEVAREMHQEAPGRILTFDLTNEDAAALEMTCGGRVRVMLDRILPTDENKALFSEWREAMVEERHSALVIATAESSDIVQSTFRALLDDSGIALGRLPLSPGVCGQLAAEVSGAGGIHVRTLENLLLVIDSGQPMPTLYLFGAGHVARPTAELATIAGFRVEVLDDRAEFSNQDRFPSASAVHILNDFNAATTGISICANDYIVIVTRGHLHDKLVLAQVLKTPALYIGMIGSLRKRDTIFRELRKEGIADMDLARVHCPVGLDIGAETPEEIAVSIVAEMISVRRG